MDVLEELTDFEDEIDRAHVEKRVEDWEKRVADLYVMVGSWLSDGWSTEKVGAVAFDDRLMQLFGIKARRIPILALKRHGQIQARLEPRELWIIGANGRVDLISTNKHFVIMDHAENFGMPDWQISDLQDRMHEAPLTCDSFFKSLV